MSAKGQTDGVVLTVGKLGQHKMLKLLQRTDPKPVFKIGVELIFMRGDARTGIAVVLL